MAARWALLLGAAAVAAVAADAPEVVGLDAAMLVGDDECLSSSQGADGPPCGLHALQRRAQDSWHWKATEDDFWNFPPTPDTSEPVTIDWSRSGLEPEPSGVEAMVDDKTDSERRRRNEKASATLDWSRSGLDPEPSAVEAVVDDKTHTDPERRRRNEKAPPKIHWSRSGLELEPSDVEAMPDDEARTKKEKKKNNNKTDTDVQTAQFVASSTCGSLDVPENADCADAVRWASGGGKWDPHANEWFGDILMIAGKDLWQASVDDFQRLYHCSPPGGKQCRRPPCQCSSPPCNVCFAGPPPTATRPGCSEESTSIDCQAPKTPMGYKGQAWPTMSFPGTGEMHIFAIGDWGGMDGTLNPIEGRPPIVAYESGANPGPSVFPRTRWDKYHQERICSHTEFIECFNTYGSTCAEGCGFDEKVDMHPQTLVAEAFQRRAADKDPQYILNVGDNFYWGGIEKTCGTPMDEMSFTAYHQFNQIFEGVYHGEGLDKKPWLSVLGNHDWGGRVFNNGWDQQIAYTWFSDRWVMPAPYWSQHVEYPDLGFSADIYMLDSNFIDAKEPHEDAEHNLCGSAHNPPDASCSVADGPASIATCPQFFRDLWSEQQQWLERQLAKSQATWQLVVTHFPCGHEQGWYRKLHQRFGLDLLVTGHRHDQELWRGNDWQKNHMGGLTCFVTGGGGGITSEATPHTNDTKDWYGEGQYGFYDLTISSQSILIQSINWNGTDVLNYTVYPKDGWGQWR